jgi:8-amino-7-oxononanoate synthase
MHAFLDDLQRSLDDLARRDLGRTLRPLPAVGRIVQRDGRNLINLASNDYLGLADHPALKQAAIDATARLGTGAGASRLVAGSLELHARCEQGFTAFKHPPSTPGPEPGDGIPAATDWGSLLFPTGYMANLAVLTTLARPGDRVLLDKLCHASLIDAARASGATVRVFPHLGYGKLARLLADTSPQDPRPTAPPHRRPRTFILTDSVFSMDGDNADLPRLCDLAQAHDAILIVDEAHGTGVLGDSGGGLAEAQGVALRVPITISTASKALGSLGGIVTAPRPVIDTLVNAGRSFIYTTATPPAQPAAILAAIQVIRDEPWRRRRLSQLSTRVRRTLTERRWRLPGASPPTPIIPLIVGEPAAALSLQARLEDAGFLAVAIRPPTVAPATARVRLSLRCDLTDDDITCLLEGPLIQRP